MKLAELPELDQQVRGLTSILLRGSDQSDEPPLRLWAHLLPELDQHQGFDVLRRAAAAPDFGPTLAVSSGAGVGDDHLLLPAWVRPSSVTSRLTHGGTGSCNTGASRQHFRGPFYTFLSIVHGASRPFQAEMCSGWAGILTGGFSLAVGSSHPRVLPLHVENVREGQNGGETCTIELLYRKVNPRSCGMENKTWQK